MSRRIRHQRLAIFLFILAAIWFGGSLAWVQPWENVTRDEVVSNHVESEVIPQENQDGTVTSEAVSETPPADMAEIVPAVSTEAVTDEAVVLPRVAEIRMPGYVYTVWFQAGENVYDIMVRAQEVSGFDFDTSFFSGMGYFVEGLDGIMNNPRSGDYWLYYINGAKADVGISNYSPQDGDIIEWKYENTL